jgi:hypothetical protein
MKKDRRAIEKKFFERMKKLQKPMAPETPREEKRGVAKTAQAPDDSGRT